MAVSLYEILAQAPTHPTTERAKKNKAWCVFQNNCYPLLYSKTNEGGESCPGGMIFLQSFGGLMSMPRIMTVSSMESLTVHQPLSTTFQSTR